MSKMTKFTSIGQMRSIIHAVRHQSEFDGYDENGNTNVNKEYVLNDIYSEVSPLVQQTDKFSVMTSPYIYLKNI